MIKCALCYQKCCASCQPRLKAEVLSSTVQESTPTVVVLLPGRFAKLMKQQTERDFTYHLLESPGFAAFTPFDFDANAFIADVLVYCQGRKVDAAIGFDCFPTMLATIVTAELGLPGPSFKSVFTCINKYYMRRELDPEMEVTTPPNELSSYPVVLKISDTQFTLGTRLCRDSETLKREWRKLTTGILGPFARGVSDRQRFYYEWASHFGWAKDYGWVTPADVELAHIEPCLNYSGEYQVEVVVLADGSMIVADSGDIGHGDIEVATTPKITLFKTPGTFTITPRLKEWLRGIVDGLMRLGYRSAALDIEFVKLNVEGDEEMYRLVEINSRYSYMGDYMGLGEGKVTEATVKHYKEVRNLVNRTLLALGLPPSTVPCIHHPEVCKFCFICPDQLAKPDDAEFDLQVPDHPLDAFYTCHHFLYVLAVLTTLC